MDSSVSNSYGPQTDAANGYNTAQENVTQAPENTGSIMKLVEAESRENTKLSSRISAMPSGTIGEIIKKGAAQFGFLLLKIATFGAAHFLDKGRDTTTKEYNIFSKQLVSLENEGILKDVVDKFNVIAGRPNKEGFSVAGMLNSSIEQVRKTNLAIAQRAPPVALIEDTAANIDGGYDSDSSYYSDNSYWSDGDC